MNRKLNPASTVAMLLAGAALAVAVVGGGAAVAGGYAKDSIAARHIKDGAVRGAHIANNAVTGDKVVDSSLTGADIKDGSLSGADVTDNSLTGADIDESSLGLVPNAERAGLAEFAEVADKATKAGQAVTAERLLGSMRASVSADGQFSESRSRGVLSSEQTPTPGRYIVTFDSPMLGCFLMAGVAHNGPERVIGSAAAWIPQTPGVPNLTKVTVETHAPGTADTVPDPLPFSLTVDCGL